MRQITCDCVAVASTSGRPFLRYDSSRHHSRESSFFQPALQQWGSVKRTHRCSRLIAAAMDYGEAYDNLFRSKVGTIHCKSCTPHDVPFP